MRFLHTSRHSGFSLVELMISMTIGLFLLLGLSTLLISNSATRTELEKSSRQVENGRYATQILAEDIHHAGFYGQFSALAAPFSSLPDPCAIALADLNLAMRLPIQGYDLFPDNHPSDLPSPQSLLSACIPDANHVAGTDILVIRRADRVEIPIASRIAGQVYLQATVAAYVLGAATGSETQAAPGVFNLKKMDKITAATLRKYHVHIYFVSPCSVPAGGGTTCTGDTDDNGRPIPTLKRLELTVAGGTAAFSVTPLVEGIENLQLDFGKDTTGDGSPDSYFTDTAPATTSTADWANVMAVRVNLLARNNDPTVGHKDTKTYSLGDGGTVGPFNDTYKRHAYSTLVRAVNPSGRRELP
jgi:type IV pilus assembly protein PilW